MIRNIIHRNSNVLTAVNIMLRLAAVTALVVICASSSCVTTQPGSDNSAIVYDGDKRPLSEVAIFTLDNPLVFKKCGNYSLKKPIDINQFANPSRSSVAVMPGQVSAELFAVFNFAGISFASEFIHITDHFESDRKYLLSGRWLLPGGTESISSWDLRHTRPIITNTASSWEFNSSRPKIEATFRGETVTFEPTILDVSDDTLVKSIIASKHDWRVRCAVIKLCKDEKFLTERLFLETNREIRAAISDRINTISGTKPRDDKVCTYIKASKIGLAPGTLHLKQGFMYSVCIPIIDNIYDPKYETANTFAFLPGNHTLKLFIVSSAGWFYGKAMPLTVETGKSYVLTWSTTISGDLHVIISDRNSKKTIVDTMIPSKCKTCRIYTANPYICTATDH